MDFAVIFNSIKNHIISFFAFVVIFGGASVFIFGEYKGVQSEKENLFKLQLDLKKQELSFEQQKTKRDKELSAKEHTLAEMEKSLKKQMSDLKVKEKNTEKANASNNQKDALLISEKNKELDNLIRDYESKLETVSTLHSLYSKEAQKVKAETKIQELMLAYSKLGVNLNSPDWCDKEYTERYYHADALLDQISAINTKHNVSEEYSWFVKRNNKSWISSSDGVCEANKAIKSDS